MPLLVEQFELSAYDLVISNSYAVAKGVLTGPDTVHVSFCQSPMRYTWDLQHQYLREANLDRGMRGWLARYMLHRLRLWDARSAAGVDVFVGNSTYIRRRIWKVYRREAAVVHPPVHVDRFRLGAGPRDDFYVTASRLVPYKRIDVLARAFALMPDRRLVVIGDGPDMARIRAVAPPNVRLLGQQPHAVLHDHLQRARAFLFAAEEDFGIAPVEAQACGTPVLAYGRGGVRDTVRGVECPHPTGLFFDEQTPEAVRDAVTEFERTADRFTPAACRTNAERFAAPRFRREARQVVDEALAEAARRRMPAPRD
jgi:glycosyltransferase involved in cell wall biosynthesis